MGIPNNRHAQTQTRGVCINRLVLTKTITNHIPWSKCTAFQTGHGASESLDVTLYPHGIKVDQMNYGSHPQPNFFERLFKKCANACHDKIRQNNA